jgi:cyclopropane-fatty-acyl-phospholipid synthase
MSMYLAGRILKAVFRKGTLVFIPPDGRQQVFGDGGAPKVVVRAHSNRMLWQMAINPHLAFGEGYMDGIFSVENGDIYDFLDLATANLGWADATGMLGNLSRLHRAIRHVQQYNSISRARRNVAHHYDLSDEFYGLFLDDDRQYSCAYFLRPDDSLELAQLQKKRHIAAKLLLEPGHKVLDIGSGWGGLGIYLATIADVEVAGVTLSDHQHAMSEARARAAGLTGRVQFRLQDYREETGRYDRVVSVGMLEHVGVDYYDAYFRKVADLLTDDGVALVHTIGRADGPGATNPWLRKYIFPGGYSPALSEITPAIERAGLYMTDIEVLRLHYAETLRAWRRRLHANRARVVALYDERFFRMWEFYLAGAEVTFRHSGHLVYQLQLAKRQHAVPLTRDYIAIREAAYARAEAAASRASAAE